MLLQVLPFVLAIGAQTPPPQTPPPVVPAAPVQTAPRVVPPPPPTYNPTDDASVRIAAAIKAAHTDEIRVLINWGANDDDRCKAFTAALRTKEVSATRYSADEYKIVNVDVGHLDKNLDVAKTYGVTLTSGALPAITVLDDTGKVLVNASANDFTLATHDPNAFDTARIAAFLTKNQAPPPPDASIPFQAALTKAKAEGKTVMVWFSAPW
jgi:hypothetical protein